MKKCVIGTILLMLFAASVSAYAETESIMDKLQSEGTAEIVYEQNFEKWTGSDGVLKLPASDSYEIVDNMERGNTFKMMIGPPTSGDKELMAEFSAPVDGSVIIRYSVLFKDTDLHRKPMAIFRDSSSTGNEMYLLLGDKSGRFLRQPSNESVMNYEADVWYEFIYVFNMNTKKYDLYINDNQVISRADFTNNSFSNFKRIWFLKLWDNTTAGEAYIDDIEVYSYKAYPSAVLSKETVAFDEDNLNIIFSSAIVSESLDGAVSVTDENGNIIKTKGTLAEDKTNYTLEFGEVLKPSSNYKIDFSENIISEDDMGIITKQLEFTTEEAVIDEILFSSTNGDITSMEGTAGNYVYAYCYVNRETEVMLIAGLYCDNRMVDVVSVKKTVKSGKRINVPIQVPDDGKKYTIKAFAWDGTENQAAYLSAGELK